MDFFWFILETELKTSWFTYCFS